MLFQIEPPVVHESGTHRYASRSMLHSAVFAGGDGNAQSLGRI